MTDSPNEASETTRHRSLRFMHQIQSSPDYELPSLRAKPRQKQTTDSGSDSDNDNDSNKDQDDDTSDDNESERDELSDSDMEDSDPEEDSDDGSIFSMDEADDLDNEEELERPTRSRDRQRRRPQQQQQDTLVGNNAKPLTSTPRKRQLGNDDENAKSLKLDDNRSEHPTSNNSSPSHQHHLKRRKLRPSSAIRSATIYNDLLSDDSEWVDQDFGIQYTNDMDTVRNDRRRKSTTASPLVLGSPSKVVKPPADSGIKQQQQQQQQPAVVIDNSAALLSPDRNQHSRQSSSSTTQSPSSSRLDEKRWSRRPQASAFLDKLQAKEEDTLDLSQHSFIPDDFLEHAAAATKTTDNQGSRKVKMGQQTTLLMKNDDVFDARSDSDDMAYPYDFSTISEPSAMVIDSTSDTIMDDYDDTHTQQISTNPPTPTPTPNTTPNEPQPAPSFFRRITSFFFG